MKTPAFIVVLAAALLMMTSCGEAAKQTKTLYGHQWWPVHASGSIDDGLFSSSWDGPLDKNGCIIVNMVHKKYPELSYQTEIYYSALDFSKKNQGFCYLDIRSLAEIKQGKYLKFEIKDGMIYFEQTDKNGRGTGKMGEGLPIKFSSDTKVQIGNVTYQEYKAWLKEHPMFALELGWSEMIPVAVYE
ncbi:MAG: hypothetical protein K6G79_08640 [Bacteroidales bacterium]|nr:hypothetical protein [Bacteroidales bacterium]